MGFLWPHKYQRDSVALSFLADLFRVLAVVKPVRSAKTNPTQKKASPCTKTWRHLRRASGSEMPPRGFPSYGPVGPARSLARAAFHSLGPLFCPPSKAGRILPACLGGRAMLFGARLGQTY
ncbi:unnamed protein product, partial [Amoebophrya sp. A120]|eukprot:GSA120T00004487001.1